MHPRELAFASLLPYVLVCSTLAGPLVREAFEDVAAVGSYIREVRAPAPLKVATEAEDLTSTRDAPKSEDAKKRMKNVSGKSDEGGYYRTYGNDAEGEKGYLKETYGKGDQGYKTLDTFRKQDGDKYEFETQTVYGGRLGKDEQQDDEKKTNTKKSDYVGAGTIADTEYVGGLGDHDEGGEYTGIDDDDHNAYGGYYTAKEPESESYGHGGNYFSADDDEGSYETHGAYESDGDADEEQEEQDY